LVSKSASRRPAEAFYRAEIPAANFPNDSECDFEIRERGHVALLVLWDSAMPSKLPGQIPSDFHHARPSLNWPAGPVRPRLAPGEIHLWRATLDNPIRLAGAEAVLAREEILRAGRLASGADRNRFIAAHGALRMVLGLYLAADPQSLEFRTGPTGKSILVQTFTDLRFNLSHSGDLALIGVTRGREVGVEVERVQRDIEFDPIVEHYFEPAEAWSLRTTSPHERAGRFFDLWTQKEARAKAGGSSARTKIGMDHFGARNLCPALGYAGAVASEGDEWELACWHWNV
jgi:4'-phosphopantetheinyl transferase